MLSAVQLTKTAALPGMVSVMGSSAEAGHVEQAGETEGMS